MRERGRTRVLAAGLAAGLLAGVVACGSRPPLLVDGDGAAWIVYPSPNDARAHPSIPIEAVFKRSFELDSPPPSAILRARAFRSVSIEVNGRPVDLPDRGDAWIEERRLEIGPALQPGGNEILARVSNAEGPPALWLALSWPGGPATGDGLWEVSRAGATWRPAARASERPQGGLFDPDRNAEHAGAAWRDLWFLVLMAGALAYICVTAIEHVIEAGAATEAGSLGVRGGALDPIVRRAPVVLALAIAAAIAVLLLNNATHLPRAAGFDADGHLEYIGRILEQGTLPLADEGWQMYQPPLYYLMAALLLRLGGWSVRQAGAVTAIRLLNLALAITNVGFGFACLRLLFPARRRRQAAGLLVAGALPAVLVIFHYPTNEALAITLASGVVWGALRLLRSGPLSLRDHLVAGLLLGAALLAKFSVLLLVPPLLAALLWNALAAPAGERRRRIGGLGALLAAALAVCGWHYARVTLRFGRPFVGNWDAVTGFAWWQEPGYRVPWDYARFGRSLAAPLYSGFAGVWDGFYSTLWGDGLCSGVAELPSRPPWSYGLMTVGLTLALLPTLAILAGAAAAVARLARRPDLTTGFLLGAAGTTAAATAFMTLRVPSYAQAKSFYGLVALVPLSALAASGIDLLAGASGLRRRLIFSALALWTLVSYAAYWTPAGAARTQVALAAGFIADGDGNEAARALQSALADDPESWNARIALADLLHSAGAPRAGIEASLLHPRDDSPPIARRGLLEAILLARDGETEAALGQLDRALAWNPDLPSLHLVRAAILEARGDLEGAVAARREALRLDPYDAANHQALAALDERAGDPEGAARHAEYARRLGPARN